MPSPSSAPSRSRGISFVAPDIAAAIVEIRAKLGSDAVILDIRRQPASGVRRLWQRPQVEVIACLPDDAEPAATPGPAPSSAATPAEDADRRAGRTEAPAPYRGVPQREALHRYARSGAPGGATSAPDPADPAPVPALVDDVFESTVPSRAMASGAPLPGEWRCRAVFERLGLIPVCAERVLATMQEIHGPGRAAPETLTKELVLARAALIKLWRPVPPPETHGAAPLHVFLGAPGSGKSTALCKWLAQTVLIDARPAQVWRLDGRTANASELVSLYGEILGVRVERTWNGRSDPSVTGFVDLGGADFRDRESLDALAGTLARLPGACVHLVLNAAYTVPLLLAQVRAFSSLPIDDLVLTHLDEELAWGKLWNLVLGTNCPLHRLGAGQNIPGRFSVAHPEQLCGSLFGG